MPPLSRVRGAIALGLTGLIALGSWYSPNLYRLYTAITLYDQDKIVSNFLHMGDAFNASWLDASPAPHRFPSQPLPLPAAFTLQGESVEIEAFLNDSATTGLLVIQDGIIRHESYYLGHQQDQQHISWSVAKSFVSALFGIAMEEGHIQSLELPVTHYVSELEGSGYDGVRIKDVLQMSSGVYFDEDYSDFHSDINRFGRTIAFGGSLDDFAASLNAEKPPGTFHHYVSIDTQVLAMILVRTTGHSLTDYTQAKLWDPLGMEHPAYWLTDDEDMELGLGGLNASLRDYGKFAWLYLNQGRWGNVQLVPAQWVKDSITPDAAHLLPGANNPLSTSSYGYGYQWWIPPGADDEFMARGIYGQYLYIDPDKRLVIVKQSANHRFTEPGHRWRPKHLALFRTLAKHYGERRAN